MRRTYKRTAILNNPLIDLNKATTGCAPCFNRALKIEKMVNNRSLNEIKIDEIKTIVKSIFECSKNDT